MSDVSGGPGWWIASDGKWYRPEQHPSHKPGPPPPASPSPPPSAPVATTDVWITAPPSLPTPPPQTTTVPATFVTTESPPRRAVAGPSGQPSTRSTAPTTKQTIRKRRWIWVVAAIVLIAIVGGIAIATKKKPAPTTATPAPVVLLRMSGSGVEHGPQFTVPRNVSWDEVWTYTCSASGSGTGNFVTHVYAGNGSLIAVGTSEIGTGGSGTNHYYDTGTFAIEVTSGCSWTIKVVTVP